jgi:uncharacterized protein YidB (DUF937 family)
MSLLDKLETQGKVLDGTSNSLATGILQMIQNHPGGLQGLMQSFHEKGLGGLASSWLGTGPNAPVTSDQIHQVLGSNQVSALAAKAGISPDAAGSVIAQLLPTIVDKLTPNGQVPDHNNFMEVACSSI